MGNQLQKGEHKSVSFHCIIVIHLLVQVQVSSVIHFSLPTAQYVC